MAKNGYLPVQDGALKSGTDAVEHVARPRRNYDMCLVFKCKTHKGVAFEDQNSDLVENRVLKEPSEADKTTMLMWKERREAIVKSLQNCDLKLFCYYTRDRDQVIVKIGAGAKKLRDTAARLKYKLQLKKQYLNAYAEFRHDFPGRPENKYKDQRTVSHMYKTYTDDTYDDSDAIFKTIDKIYLIHHIITSNDQGCAGIQVGNLLYNQQLEGYFPLHETALLEDLRSKWLEWYIMSEEHANNLRDYFGDRIAFYFLFLAFYWKWLVPIAVLGLLLQFIDLFPQTPDNITAIPFCIFLSVWAVFLPYFWRRQEAKYAIGWGTLDFNQTLEPPRPEHHGEPRINPVTAQVEPYYPWQQRVVHYACSAATIIFVGMVVCSVSLGLLLLRSLCEGHFFGSVVAFQFLTAMYVEVSNYFLTQLASWLTDRENHRSQSEHVSHMLAKVMGLKFVNSYFVLYYIAFMKKHTTLFGVEMECRREDCFVDLQGQLSMFVFFRLTISNSVEYFWPKVKDWWQSMREKQTCLSYLHGHTLLETAEMSPAEQQAIKEPYEAFEEFEEQLISHGYATLFAVTAPWVCFLTLLGTLLEIRIDKNVLMDSRQRPIPSRARSNEPWTSAFELYGIIAASTNVMLLIFASEQYASFSMTEKLTLFVYLEHMIFLARLGLRFILPEVPRNVDVLQLKQDSMAHRCLENIKVEQAQDLSMFRERRSDIQVEPNDYTEEEEVEPALSMEQSFKVFREGVVETATGKVTRHRL